MPWPPPSSKRSTTSRRAGAWSRRAAPAPRCTRGTGAPPAWSGCTARRCHLNDDVILNDKGRMRVLLVAEQLRRRVPGGIGTYVRGLVSGLRALGPGPDVTLWASAHRDGDDPL